MSRKKFYLDRRREDFFSTSSPLPTLPPDSFERFYKKGCQEKSSTSTGGEKIFSLHPAHCLLCPPIRSRGSIKRDVKKKVLPRPEARRFFLYIQPTAYFAPRFVREVL